MDDEELLKLNLVHPIHTTERRSFRGCRRRWNWIFREFYYPRTTPRPLEFGVAYHAAMEVWYDPETWDDPERGIVNQSLSLIKFDEIVAEQKAKYVKLNGPMPDEMKEDYKERVEFGHAMIKYYTERVSPKLDTGFRPIGVEVPFEIPLGFNCKCDICFRRYTNWLGKQGPQHEEAFRALIEAHGREKWKGLPVTYGGRVDMIAIDKYDRLWLFDWKTTSRILNEGDESSFLELEDQVTSYIVALYKLGRPVAGFVYHEQRKAVPAPPALLTRRMKGRIYSTAKNQSTSKELFIETVMKGDPDGLAMGFYDDYIHWLETEGPQYFQRHQIQRNKTQIETAWNDMVEEAKDIILNPRIYPQPGRFSCTTCAFRQPCLGKNMGEDYTYTLNTMFEKRTKHYFEEQEEVRSTDPEKIS